MYDNNAWSNAAFEISSSGVLSFESRTGHINLQTADITGLGTAVYTGIVDSRFTTDAEAIGFSLVFGS